MLWRVAAPLTMTECKEKVRYRFAGICGTALSLSACAVGPDYRPPQATSLGVPATYYQGADLQGVAPTVGDSELAQWWTRLNDPTLSALIDTAVANNLDIVQAQARLRQARESLAQTNAAFLPQLNASGNGGKNYRSQAGGTRVDDSGNVISTGASNWSSSYSANTSASWQIDLFGELSRSAEAARARARRTTSSTSLRSSPPLRSGAALLRMTWSAVPMTISFPDQRRDRHGVHGGVSRRSRRSWSG